MNRVIMIMAAAMLGVVVTNGVATADTPGINCKYYGTQADDAFFDPNGYSANGLKNISTSSRYAVCPFEDIEAPVSSISIRLSTAADVCKVYEKDNYDFSTIVHTRSWFYTYNSSHTLHVFEIGQSGGYPANASYTLYCNVPAGGVIRSYFVNIDPL